MSPKLLSLLLLSATAFSQMAPQGSAASQPRASAVTLVDTTLASVIDSAKARQGDPITATVSSDTTLPAGGLFPQGTSLVGHVTQVRPFEKNGATPASISILFDQAKTKDGNVTAIISIMKVLKPASTSRPAGRKNTSDTATGEDGSIATSVPHVSLTPPSDQTSTSGTLTSTKGDVHVAIGSRLTLAVAAQGQ